MTTRKTFNSNRQETKGYNITMERPFTFEKYKMKSNNSNSRERKEYER